MAGDDPATQESRDIVNLNGEELLQLPKDDVPTAVHEAVCARADRRGLIRPIGMDCFGRSAWIARLDARSEHAWRFESESLSQLEHADQHGLIRPISMAWILDERI